MHAPTNTLRSRKHLVEDCLSVDTELLLQRGIIVPGFRRSGTFYWTGSGKRIASAAYESEMIHPAASWLRLRFPITDPDTGQSRYVDQFVPLTRSDPGFGKVRYWFVDDGRRVRLLHLPPGADQFRSRHVHRLAYASQRITRSERRRRREYKIKRRLGADPSSQGIPPKPPRMRYRTYDRLVARLRRGETQSGQLTAHRIIPPHRGDVDRRLR
jgi:hypothetical protein